MNRRARALPGLLLLDLVLILFCCYQGAELHRLRSLSAHLEREIELTALAQRNRLCQGQEPYLRKPCLVPWGALQAQFGADYGRLRDFERKFVRHLGDVPQVYPAARFCELSGGLLLRPSPTQLPRAPAIRRSSPEQPGSKPAPLSTALPSDSG